MQSADADVGVNAIREDADNYERYLGGAQTAPLQIGSRSVTQRPPAVEHGCEWMTLDRGCSIHPGLRFRNLLNG